jgi:hypothetical protein
MSDLYDQVTSDQDPFTKILKKIPGFSGYIDREARRAADKMLRDTIGQQFQQLWGRIGNVQQDFADQGELSYLDDLEKAAMKVQTFIDKITGASYGYSGFFDAQKINEDELAKIYEFDAALLEFGDSISRAIDNVEASVGDDGLPAAIHHLVTLTRDLVTAYEGRDLVLQSMEA